MKILTICRMGLSRSLALADVLKFHFPPADALPVGLSANSAETLKMLVWNWANKVVLMREKFRQELRDKIGSLPEDKILVCEVGPDIHGYAGAGRAVLIDQVWRWARANQLILGVQEGKNYTWHQDKITT